MESSRALGGVDICIGFRIARILKVLFVFLLLASFGSCDRRKGLRQHMERFFCSVDQDGDGEIEQHEATKFLSSFHAKLDLAEESKDDNGGDKDVPHDFVPLHNFKGDFSYGGATISAEEMLDHLQNMLTADRVVDWITHGLQLPQYAQRFQENAVNGLDFPALIADHSQTLLYELQVQSLLHRKKITNAIVRQMFGYGAVPGPPENLMCECASCGVVQLHWVAPSFVGYPPLHKYLIEKRNDNPSLWMSIGDSKENSFLDKDGIYQGKLYNYRLQAWGNHGPSEWVQIHGCHCSDIPASDKDCDMEALKKPAGTTPQVEGFSEGRGISTVDLQRMEVVNERSAGWGWMYAVNGFLIILGIISRLSLFFRVILASWILFRDKVLCPIYKSLIQAQNSEYILWRIIGCTFINLLSFCHSMQAKIWDLSGQVNGAYPGKFSVNPRSPYKREYVAEIESYNDNNEFSVINRSVDDTMIGTLHNEDLLPSKFSSENQGSALNLETMQYSKASLEHQNQCIDGSTNAFLLDTDFTNAAETETLIQKNPDAKGKYMKSMKRIMTMGRVRDGRSNFTASGSKVYRKRSLSAPNQRVDNMYLSDHRKGELSKMPSRKSYRCNYEGCKSRFDRWHSPLDWQMTFRKHYCRDCQGVFCVKHTRISPHGPFGQCGLDSSCVCQDCFERLDLEARESLEQINKLRVGPYVSGVSISNEKKRKFPSLKKVSSHTNINKVDLSRKNSMHETQNDHCSQIIGRDPYPQNLDLAYSSDSSDSSPSKSGQNLYRSSTHSHKVHPSFK